MEKDKIVFKGSHPDSLYRVPADSGIGSGKMSRFLRILRWPAALIVVCIALAVFVYFLMPNNIEADAKTENNNTHWESTAAGINSQSNVDTPRKKLLGSNKNKSDKAYTQVKGAKPSEMDFYDTDKNVELTTVMETITEISPKIPLLPVIPVFPTHITPEVQYGNEKADNDKLRTPRLFDEVDVLPEDSTLKPHITQKPEKPLEIYFKDTTSMSTETIARSESVNDFTSLEEKLSTKKATEFPIKSNPLFHKDHTIPEIKQIQQITNKLKVSPDVRQELPPELQEFYDSPTLNAADVTFTSGHSKLFGISIEDAEKMKSTTQSSLYNTKVSPTLPTWRDDTTTKNYPSNIPLEVPQCHSTRLALCRGVLPYDLAGTAASVGGVEVTNLMSQIEYLVATNCSDRVRHFFCALLEPECNPPPYPPKMPCYNLCKAIVDHCDGLIPRELTPAFKCRHYLKNNCVAAKTPCYPRELTCGDSSCVPRDWICDGTEDCPGGEDEAVCVTCDKHEFRCQSGGCIQKRWVCDGYADCTNGEDEDEYICADRGVGSAAGERQSEPGEESAGSAPAPVVRRPNRGPISPFKSGGENDSSKELLVTSDSSNPYKRNFTRRPSPSRLTPYTRYVPAPNGDKPVLDETTKKTEMRKYPAGDKKQRPEAESVEDVNIEDLGFFEDLKKEIPDEMNKGVSQETTQVSRTKSNIERSEITTTSAPSTRLDKSINKLERVINGAALLKKAESVAKAETASYDIEDSPESNPKTVSDGEGVPNVPRGESISAHVSPCPSGELRCVDGRCITLAQLCDGTIDCSDHADEDNCFT